MIKFKEQYVCSAWISDAGYICFEQYDHGLGENVTLMLSPEQFSAVERLVKDNSVALKMAWNNGVHEVDDDATDS